MRISKVASIYTIPYQALIQQGVKLFIFDADDTLGAYQFESVPEKTASMLVSIHELGATAVVVSNASHKRKQRLENLLAPILVFVVHSGRKPDPGVFRNLMNGYHILPTETIMVGDRVGTDLWGAYLAGIPNLYLVKPYSLVFGGMPILPIIRWIRSYEERLVQRYQITRRACETSERNATGGREM